LSGLIPLTLVDGRIMINIVFEILVGLIYTLSTFPNRVVLRKCMSGKELVWMCVGKLYSILRTLLQYNIMVSELLLLRFGVLYLCFNIDLSGKPL
jgi:hypothetical protein